MPSTSPHSLNISKRDPWLDFLRAAAILMVMIHHMAQEWPVLRPWLAPYTSVGANGVDLFFVLSGWLIGGLFWREKARNGNVRLFRFWSRRWLRTIPPYLGGLTLAWVAVLIYRNEPFDFGYLIFIQNYYQTMPFFFVSWSLCIEEHFYLFIPLAFYLWKKQPWVLLVLLVVLPTLFRLTEYPIQAEGFGYPSTATHLHADGLLLGFGAAYLNTFHPDFLSRLRPFAIVMGFAAAAVLMMPLTTELQFILTPLLVALLFLGLLLLLVQQPSGQYFASLPAAWMARISYSIYLTHALVIHVFVLGIYPWVNLPELVALLLEFALILAAGWVFHMIFERWAFRLREKLVPGQ